jgi:histone H3/H4
MSGQNVGPNLEQALSRLQLLITHRINSGSGKMDEMGQRLILEYIQELTRTILEHASSLAKYRDSKKIEPADVALIFGNILTSF